MTFFRRLMTWLRFRPRRIDQLGLVFRGVSIGRVFQTPSGRQIDSALQPAQRARSAGALNSPPADQRDLSSDEASIVMYFKTLLDATAQRAHDSLTFLRDCLRREQATVTLPNIDRAFAGLDAELRRLKLEWTGRLIEVNKDRLEAWRNLRHFRAAHRLDREAVYPESFIYDFMLLFAMVALETVGNAFFYQAGNERGFAGGVANAFIISVVNVFMAFFVTGYIGLRHLHVRSVLLKIAAWFAVLGGGLGVVLLNLAAAHYRDLLSADPQQPFIKAAAAIYTRGFALDTLPALALLLLGYTLAVFAAYKGYTYDDRLPGYGTVTRRHELMKSRQRGAELAFREALGKASREHAAAVERELDTFRESVRDRQAAIALYDQIRSYFPDYQVNVVQRLCDATLRRYREENARVRTSAIPPCFRDYPVMAEPWTEPELPEPLRDLSQAIADLRAADAQFARLKADFLDRVEIFFQAIEHEIANLESLAQARLDRREPLS